MCGNGELVGRADEKTTGWNGVKRREMGRGREENNKERKGKKAHSVWLRTDQLCRGG